MQNILTMMKRKIPMMNKCKLEDSRNPNGDEGVSSSEFHQDRINIR